MIRLSLVAFFLLLGPAGSGTAAPQYTGDQTRDPFGVQSAAPVKKITQDTSPTSFKLQGVVWDARLPQAVINDTVVKVGGKVSGAEVSEITKQGVKLKYQDKDLYLHSKGDLRR